MKYNEDIWELINHVIRYRNFHFWILTVNLSPRADEEVFPPPLTYRITSEIDERILEQQIGQRDMGHDCQWGWERRDTKGPPAKQPYGTPKGDGVWGGDHSMANHDSNEKLYVRSEEAQILIHKRVRFCLEVLIFNKIYILVY